MKLKLSMLLVVAFVFLSSGTTSNDHATNETEKGMVKVTLLYANATDKTFDMNYYTNTHMPLVARLMGDALKQYKIDKGIAGRTPQDPVPYLAIGYLYFDSLEAYETAFAPNAAKIVGDIPNFTTIRPTVQISEIVK